jgi:phosphoribosylformylglycinamidine synthase
VFPAAGLEIVLLGEGLGELGGSEYLKTVHGLLRGQAPVLDLERARRLERLMVSLLSRGLAASAHDCSDGGLAVALAECCFDSGGIGADIEIASAGAERGLDRIAGALFGESASRVILAVQAEHLVTVLAAAAEADIPGARIGRTGGASIRIHVDGDLVIDCAVDEAEARWATSLAARMDETAA